MSNARHTLITGGSSGIGQAMGRRLAAAGYNVSLIARRQDVLHDAAVEMRKHSVRADQRVTIHAADVADQEQAEAAVRACTAELGPVDLLITSAGIAVPGYFSEMSASVFERSMAVNFFGTLYVIRAALPGMRARKQGRIVLISSGAALLGLFGYGSYGPSKFAVRGLAETLRAELRHDNIGVSIAYPPDTATPMLEEENKTKPEETKLICELAKTWSADAVAACIVRAVERGRFAITPGLTITLMQRMPGIVLPVLSWYCERLVDGVRHRSAQLSEARGKVIGSA